MADIGIAKLVMAIRRLNGSNAEYAAPLRAMLQRFEQMSRTEDDVNPTAIAVAMNAKSLLPLTAMDLLRFEHRSTKFHDYDWSWYNENFISNLVKAAQSDKDTNRVFGCPSRHAQWALVSETPTQ